MRPLTVAAALVLAAGAAAAAAPDNDGPVQHISNGGCTATAEHPTVTCLVPPWQQPDVLDGRNALGPWWPYFYLPKEDFR